ncbi:unnamed protein product [Fusarium equiseti]|uniref:Uncharacterized protein n=1 Tax=Fusarium equiseti TaxID=61235 RepID=A0A8J2NHL8_FUSEQ|nr:unnamed protein product [Fusarium equiseti]
MTVDNEIQGLRLVKLIGGTADQGTPEARLDGIYRKVLAFPTRNIYKDERSLMFKRYRCILGLVALAFEPPSVATIERLLKREGIRKTLMDFRFILEVPPDDQSAVSFFHMSFRDFLLAKERSGVDFFVDLAQVHHDLFLNCLAILNRSLHQDMCGLADSGFFASEIPKAQIVASPTDDVLASLSEDYMIILWDMETTKIIDQIIFDEGKYIFASARVQMIKRIDVPGTVTYPTEGLAFAGSLPILASANYMGCLRLWDTDVASPAIAKKTRIHSLYFPAGNNTMVLVVSEDCDELLNLQTGARQIFLTDTRAVAFSPAQDLVAFCFKNDTIQFWDGTLTRLIKTFSGFSDVFFPKCGTLVVLMSNNKALLLEYHTLNSQCLIELPRESVLRAGPILTSKAISIVTKSDEKESNKIWLFRCDTGELLWGVENGQLLRKWKADDSIDRSFEGLEANRQHFTIIGGWLPSPTGDNTTSCSTLTKKDTGLLDVEGGWVWQGNNKLLCLPSEFNPDGDFTSAGYVSWPVKAFNNSEMLFKKEAN